MSEKERTETLMTFRTDALRNIYSRSIISFVNSRLLHRAERCSQLFDSRPVHSFRCALEPPSCFMFLNVITRRFAVTKRGAFPACSCLPLCKFVLKSSDRWLVSGSLTFTTCIVSIQLRTAVALLADTYSIALFVDLLCL